MQRLAVLMMLILTAGLIAQEEFSGPPQAKRGYELFFKAADGVSCSACHAMKGKGTPAGPDLTKIAYLNPKAIVMAIFSSRTMYVQEFKLQTGDTFPAMKAGEQGDVVKLYDLSKTPPQLREVKKAEIDSMRDNNTWKHPVESKGFSKEQLADVIGYIKFAGAGDRKEVKPSDI